MNISLEISYYPLDSNSHQAIKKFIDMLNESKLFKISVQPMSTLIYGKYDDILPFLSDKMKQIMSEYPSIFVLKISNACPV
ncbi:MAG: thiamine-binding protein [Bacteroidales bacterium]|nr:thiamine-binding protein [Bacteroidales bacterium]